MLSCRRMPTRFSGFFARISVVGVVLSGSFGCEPDQGPASAICAAATACCVKIADAEDQGLQRRRACLEFKLGKQSRCAPKLAKLKIKAKKHGTSCD